MTPALQDIPRHKTAIGRVTLSRPVKLALADGLIDSETALFDYGCGRGDDIRILSVMGAGHRHDPRFVIGQIDLIGREGTRRRPRGRLAPRRPGECRGYTGLFRRGHRGHDGVG